jgi:PHS family inorganic phosphate transporter-like MFS transporter
VFRNGWFDAALSAQRLLRFPDAYDIFAINIASTMIAFVYHGNSLTVNQDLGLKVATPIGTFVGQLLFGWLADVVGRKRMYGVELLISKCCEHTRSPNG